MTMQWAGRRPMGLTTLPAEALAVPEPQRLAWLFGRASIDGLGPADGDVTATGRAAAGG